LLFARLRPAERRFPFFVIITHSATYGLWPMSRRVSF
jgi:hypothetical protein